MIWFITLIMIYNLAILYLFCCLCFSRNIFRWSLYTFSKISLFYSCLYFCFSNSFRICVFLPAVSVLYWLLLLEYSSSHQTLNSLLSGCGRTLLCALCAEIAKQKACDYQCGYTHFHVYALIFLLNQSWVHADVSSTHLLSCRDLGQGVACSLLILFQYWKL